MVKDRDPDPEFGPPGYLPERAAKRARKIVLRAPLGLQWVVASLLAGVVVVAAGVLFLTRGAEAPGEPWVAVGSIDEVAGEVTGHPDLDLVLVGAVGRVRAFADEDGHLEGLVYCADSRRLEAADGRVWSVTGRGFNDVPSLAEHPILIRSEVVYVDPTRTTPGPAPSTDSAEPACV